MTAPTVARARLAREIIRLDPVAAHAERIRVMAVYEAGQVVRDGLAPYVPFRVVDGYATDAEYLDEVTCADCGQSRDDLLAACDACGVRDCTVEDIDCRYDSRTFCDECRPSHRGCPECDPPDPKDH